MSCFGLGVMMLIMHYARSTFFSFLVKSHYLLKRKESCRICNSLVKFWVHYNMIYLSSILDIFFVSMHVLLKCNWSIFQVNYINAHATSTLAGDLAEINAIKKVFKDTAGIKINATKVISLYLSCACFHSLQAWADRLYGNVAYGGHFLLILSSCFQFISVYDRALPRCCWRFGSHCHCESHNNRMAASYYKPICMWFFLLYTFLALNYLLELCWEKHWRRLHCDSVTCQFIV